MDHDRLRRAASVKDVKAVAVATPATVAERNSRRCCCMVLILSVSSTRSHTKPRCLDCFTRPAKARAGACSFFRHCRLSVCASGVLLDFDEDSLARRKREMVESVRVRNQYSAFPARPGDDRRACDSQLDVHRLDRFQLAHVDDGERG